MMLELAVKVVCDPCIQRQAIHKAMKVVTELPFFETSKMDRVPAGTKGSRRATASGEVVPRKKYSIWTVSRTAPPQKQGSSRHAAARDLASHAHNMPNPGNSPRKKFPTGLILRTAPPRKKDSARRA